MVFHSRLHYNLTFIQSQLEGATGNAILYSRLRVNHYDFCGISFDVDNLDTKTLSPFRKIVFQSNFRKQYHHTRTVH